MKKIILFVLSMLLVAYGYAQDKKDSPVFKTYVSVSGSVDDSKEPGFSFEFGRWGMTSPLTYGLDIDHNYNNKWKKPTTWIGPKVYYAVHADGNLSVMIYASPKWQLGGNGFLLENGIVAYFNVTANDLLSISQYFQSWQNSNFNPGISICYLRLL